jgi:hypothetical protein
VTAPAANRTIIDFIMLLDIRVVLRIPWIGPQDRSKEDNPPAVIR